MKKRYGFVSNSSTTSFCIYGAHLSKDKVREVFGLEEDDDVYDELYEKVEKGNGLIVEYDPWDSYVWIGSYWTSIQDAETGLMFKERVKLALDKIGFTGVDLGTHEEAWRDG